LPGRLASLVSPTNSFDHDQVPVVSDEEASIATGALAVYRAAPVGTSERRINRLMTTLSVGYPNLKLSQDEADARIGLYAAGLGDIAADVLAAGFTAALRTCKFFPSVSEIRELAMSQPAPPRMVRQARLAALVRAHASAEKAKADPFDVSEANAEMERIGSRWRFNAGGGAYQADLSAPGELDQAA
jgi:hypothetical protein